MGGDLQAQPSAIGPAVLFLIGTTENTHEAYRFFAHRDCLARRTIRRNLPARLRRTLPKPHPAKPPRPAQAAMDRDLPEITIPQLQRLYTSHRYSVTQVVEWYLARIARYNGVYRAVQNVDVEGALSMAAADDAALKSGNPQRGLLWGVPILIKANTSVKGWSPPTAGKATAFPAMNSLLLRTQQ